MSYAAKHRRAGDFELTSSGARTPLDIWLRREMKARFDPGLREALPEEWLEMLDQAAEQTGRG